MIKTVVSGVMAWLLLGGSALAQSTAALFPSADSASQNSVKLTTVIMALPAGDEWLSFADSGSFCLTPRRTEIWSGGRQPQDLPPYSAAFKTELERAGFKVVTPGEDNLFDQSAGVSDYEAAAVISSARIKGCVNSGWMWSNGDINGEGTLKVDWQVYSRIRKQVVARVSTTGGAKLANGVAGGAVKLLADSFASNVRELAANASFREALSGSKTLAQGPLVPGQQGKIYLAGNLKAPARPIPDAVGSVVTLQVGGASGSGVLVSDDGYLLTNAHVVGDAKEIRVRWSDRIETIGQVVRVAKDRDIALVKTNARDRIPLAIKRGAVSPGQRVFAIGTPLDKTFQGTVSSGIVSANRIIDGLRYIQSDTNILPGSSGGALLDETGAVIGIAVSGYQKDGQAVGLNMFIPIGDAMDFLSLERQ